MDCNEKVVTKALVVGSNTSSSAVSSAEAKEHMLDATNSPESLQEFLKSFPKDLCHSNFNKEKKLSGTSRCKTVEQKRGMKENKTSDNQFSKKQPRKGENPNRIPYSEDYSDLAAKTLVCKNSACKALLAPEDTFCRRCSCCICHIFDDNKDPSLWLVCSSESGDHESCGLSCHIECALQHQKVGVVNLGQFMQLDGSYCCASCGKVSGIIGCWKKQLLVAKDARRVDILCHRIWLSYRLLDGTSRFKELHNVIIEAKAKLETEVGALDGVSAKMGRGIVSRLAVAGELQDLCCVAIERADKWLDSVMTPNAVCREGGSLPAACKFQFEEISSSSIVIVLKETSSNSNSIKGYKLWYKKSRGQPPEKEPIVFPRSRRRILISNLQPCTEYTFRIISFTDTGDFGHSESKCFTKSVEIMQKNLENTGTEGQSSNGKRRRNLCPTSSSGFKVRDLGKILRAAWAEEHSGIDGFCYDGMDESIDGNLMKPETADEEQQPCVFVTRGLDLNVTNVPDLNIDAAPPSDCSPNEDNGCTSGKKEGPAGSNESNDSLTWADRPACEIPGIESQSDLCKKQTLNANDDGASSLINCTPLHGSAGRLELDDHYEYCVKVIRWLECRGYIEREFRMKFLTWFSLRSTKQERRVVRTFIDTLVDDPGSLAGQLVDSFLEIVLSKWPRNGFCSKLWH